MNVLDVRKNWWLHVSEAKFYLFLLFGMGIVTAGFMLNLGLDLHRNFLTTACDTAAFQNALVNTLYGSWFRDTAYDGPNILGLHTTLVLLLVAPFYALFPTINTLFILQIVGIYSTVIPLYLVALELLNKPIAAFCISGATLASPLLLHMAMAPFHPETWASAAVLWSYLFYLRNRATGYWVSFGFAVSCGEQVALIYVVFGAAIFLVDDGLAWRKRYGIWAISTGIGWLMVTAVIILPFIRSAGQQNLFTYNYSDWGIQSAPGLVIALVESPFRGFAMMLSPARWMHVAALVGLPLLLAMFSVRSLILLAAFPFYFLMSDQEFFLPFHAYYFQFAFLAAYLGLIYFLKHRETTTRIGITVIIGTAFINMLSFCSAFGVYAGLDSGRDEVFNQSLIEIFSKIPEDAGVYGPHRFSEYLSEHPNMVMGDLTDENLDFNAMLDKTFGTTNVHPEQIDYIVCDLLNDQCGWRQDNFSPDDMKRRTANVDRLIQSGQWRLCFNQKSVVILQRTGLPAFDR